MPTLTVPQAFALALQHHQSGRLTEAEALYRQVLAVESRHAGALHHLGVLAHQGGRLDLAEGWIRQSLATAPANAIAHCDLGEVLRAMGRTDDAIASYHTALQYDPQCAEAHANLGVALSGIGQFDEALTAFRRALELEPDHALFHYNLGNLLRKRSETKEAGLHLQRAVELQPDLAIAWNNLGNVLMQDGRGDEAVQRFRRAVALRPDYGVAWFNLGNTLAAQGKFGEAIAAFRQAARFKAELPEVWNNLGGALLENALADEAAAAFRQAIQIKPDFAEACSNLGKALQRLRRFDEAIVACRRALALRPDLSTTWIDLGNTLKEEGLLDDAIVAFRRAVECNPNDPVGHSNAIYTLHFHPHTDPAAIANGQKRWNERFGRPQSAYTSHGNEPLPSRRLRIGYVSPEFRDHVTGRYLMPLFQNHRREDFEILCYSGAIHPDRRTDEFRRLADQWRVTKGVTDEAMARMIREDKVDILVDLTQHLADNRLPVFSYQAAPVQVSFAGYPESTGVEAIGCRISDRYLEAQIVTSRDKDIKREVLLEAINNAVLAAARKAVGPVKDLRVDFDPKTGDPKVCARLTVVEKVENKHGEVSIEIAKKFKNDVQLGEELEMPVTPRDFKRIATRTAKRAMMQRIRQAEKEMIGDEFKDRAWTIVSGTARRRERLKAPEEVFLIDSFWCYDPCGVEIEVTNSRKPADGPIRFGCLNNFCKTNESVLKLWARLLREVQPSRLTILSPEGNPRRSVLKLMQQEGVDPGRVQFVEMCDRTAYLELYNQLDIALDPFPYDGHTTTLDALWMGVPIVSLVGRSAVSYAGLSQLANLGLEEFAAWSTDDYVRIARELAGDRPRLAELRRTLRARMQASPLMDASRFARQIEAAYRVMWRRWCASTPH